MAYQIAATAVTLNYLEGHSPVASLIKYNPSNICAAFYTISTDSMLAVTYESGEKVDNNDTRKVRFVNLRPLHIYALLQKYFGVQVCRSSVVNK